MIRQSTILALALAYILLVAPVSLCSETVDPKILLRAKSEAETLWRKGYLLGDQKIDAMLQALLDSVVAGQTVDPVIQLRAHAFRSPEINAFALPDGSIYVFIGLLSNLTSRDQLAFILAHEAQHAIDLHGQKNIEQAKDKAGIFGLLSLGASIALGSTGLAGAGLINSFAQLGLSLAAVASINGYGRDLERNADMAGLAMMQQAGMDDCGGVRSMQVLLENDEDIGRVTNFFWGSHPLLRERIAYLAEAVTDSCALVDARADDSYETFRWAMTGECVKLWLTTEEPRQGLHTALRYFRRFPDDPLIHCELGDLYLQISADYRARAARNAMRANEFLTAAQETLLLAVNEYETSRALGGEGFRLPFRGLALAAESVGDTAACVAHLEKYLEGDTPVPNRRAMTRKLRDLRWRLPRLQIQGPGAADSLVLQPDP